MWASNETWLQIEPIFLFTTRHTLCTNKSSGFSRSNHTTASCFAIFVINVKPLLPIRLLAVKNKFNYACSQDISMEKLNKREKEIFCVHILILPINRIRWLHFKRILSLVFSLRMPANNINSKSTSHWNAAAQTDDKTFLVLANNYLIGTWCFRHVHLRRNIVSHQ